MAQIICKNLSMGYEGARVIENVNFSLCAGDYLCVVGENGSGKSTLIKGLLKLKKPMSGEILTGDGLRSGEIGYLPQQAESQRDFPAGVFEVVLSGRQNSLGLRPFYSRRDKLEAEKNLSLMGISHLKNHSYQALSGGQRQRVLLARALCATKKMLLLDEPVAGLDPEATAALYSLIEKINKEMGITIIMVSHDMHSSLKFATHILHLGHCQLFFGPTDEYTRSPLGRKYSGGVEND